jgi:hypothetical protein
MPYFGYCEQERPGVIFRWIMEIGKIHIVASVGGETKEFGRKYWKL